MWIDSHCHLEKFTEPGELERTLEAAQAARVSELITVGTRLADWPLYQKLAQSHAGVHWTAGLHPCEVDADWPDAVSALASFFATEPRPVALGEIGLDYFHLPKFPDEAAELQLHQKAAFKAQLELAYQLDCPVVIHSRQAFTDTLALIDASGIDPQKVVFHCFSEGPEAIRALNERGARGSFTGIVTYKNQSTEPIRAAALAQGIERLMIETDAPYLTPEPHRGTRNQPAYVAHTGEYLAALFGLSARDFAAQVSANTRAFFRLPPHA